ncbi:hypothetical protein BU17DRAFT_94044 [Hysterangium stoloniferum]|nr:hypothetical protein BU17DRAFT_94044 [Hysterangium stoloniferum]
MTTTAFPWLPVEILRIIIETAARDNRTAVILAIVCRTFNQWTTPILYNTISITPFTILNLYHASNGLKLSYTRNLFFDIAWEPTPHNGLVNMLQSCRNVSRLLLLIVHDPPFNAPMRPYQISIMNIQLCTLNWQQSNIFEHATHIFVEHGFRIKIEHWRALRALTHLGISGGGWHPIDVRCIALVHDLLSLPSIKILLVCCFPARQCGGKEWVELAKTSDKRLFVRPAILDHIALFRAGRSIWDDVDEFRDWRTSVEVTGAEVE